ncbi:Aspartate aminotransferase [Aquisphaera giovannonii]|uniref:Aspartate aminotransferase n=1 Tax=Aquisphaera giovannonii TaxID=406548 RepID=A0A5B9W1V0_9BACT|nr:aminotransferase class I/II-fold pyridoxal phosphate-dependent enzyme [Aquisphaera giovannonii]QEH34576.1 Aspartate aminotransferase [Aquisphaera giovannonii]
MIRFSELAGQLTAETAFTVLAMARALKARGKDVVELEIGDSPFPTTPHASAAGIRAIEENQTGYCPSMGLPQFREAAARSVTDEFGYPASAENVVVASGAKPFEQYFAEAFLDPGDGVLVFSPQFPTYVPNIARRGARPLLVPLRVEDAFRPRAEDVRRFLETDPRPRAVFLNSPHNPTGGVATAEDLAAIADVVRGTDLMVFSDEPYCHMVWSGRHTSILSQPGMFEHAVAAYTFSKSYSMSGWRIGFAVAHPEVAEMIGKLINTTASCSPPLAQWAARAALERDRETRDEYMGRFRAKVERLCQGLKRVEGLGVSMPAGTFYVFPDVRRICNRLGITSHGLALYLLEGADDAFGVACLGGECFGDAGAGFLRFSCAEPDDRIDRAVAFLPEALTRTDRVRRYLGENPKFALREPYPVG